ncbi:unnamed protein product, partial [Hymenolepis diminuta]
MELEALAERHSRAIESLRKAESIESEALNEMRPTAETLKSLLTELVSVTKELNHAEAEHTAAISQRLTKLDQREEVVRMAEERLCDRQKEIDKMHLMLTDAIGKLEVQLKAQSKSLEDDRWTLKQEQMRLSKLQVVMEDDKRALIEHAGKERVELQQLITKFFEEHRQIQSQMATERKSFLEEQQKLKTDQTN